MWMILVDLHCCWLSLQVAGAYRQHESSSFAPIRCLSKPWFHPGCLVAHLTLRWSVTLAKDGLKMAQGDQLAEAVYLEKKLHG